MELTSLEIAFQIMVLSWIYDIAYTQGSNQATEASNYVHYFFIDPRNEYFNEDESRDIEARASESDVSYHFYSRNHKAGLYVSDNLKLLNDTDFTSTRDTVFIIHGWRGHLESHFSTNVKLALLDHNVNMFVVDWSPIATRNYFVAQRAVLQVGNFIAVFVQKLISTYGLDLSKVAFVGHSLGAHVAGNTGAALRGQIAYIVGLDPASPLFYRLELSNRLDSTDAKFVQAIHSCGGYLGVFHEVGHSDYYPNGGTKQPGCGLDLLGFCAHRRAWEYYMESVSAKINSFVATKCVNYQVYLEGKCKHNSVSLMAGYSIDMNASGNYFLMTNEHSPYGKG